MQQTVRLNTPGEQDGGFWLDVDGVRVLERGDIYYRGDPSASSEQGAKKPAGEEAGGGGGLLGGLLRRWVGAVVVGPSQGWGQRVVGLSAPANTTMTSVLPNSTPVVASAEGIPKPRPIGFVGLFFRYVALVFGGIVGLICAC